MNKHKNGKMYDNLGNEYAERVSLSMYKRGNQFYSNSNELLFEGETKDNTPHGMCTMYLEGKKIYEG